jgi:hypothetical protein
LYALSVLRSKDFSDAPRSQLWADALFFRAMAKEAANNYLSSMCVRKAILSAWTTLEMACCNALGIKKLERDFKESLHSDFDKRNIPRLNLSSGLWQEINPTIKGYRKLFVHSGVTISIGFRPFRSLKRRFRRFERQCTISMHELGSSHHAGPTADQSGGWPRRGLGAVMSGRLTISDARAHPDTPGVVKIGLVTELCWN